MRNFFHTSRIFSQTDNDLISSDVFSSAQHDVGYGLVSMAGNPF